MRNLIVFMVIMAFFVQGCSVDTSNETNNSVPEKEEHIVETLQIDEWLLEKAQPVKSWDLKSEKYQSVVAFLKKDIATLADLVSSPSDEEYYLEVYSEIASIEISDYSVEEVSDREIIFDFTVIHSDSRSFPIGDYSYHISDGISGPLWTITDKITVDSNYKSHYDVAYNLSMWGLDENGVTTDRMQQVIYYSLIQWNFKALTKDELLNGAKVLFGVDDYVIPNNIMKQNNEGKYIWGMLASPCVASSLSNLTVTEDTVVVEIQTYADYSSIIKSHLVACTFVRSDNEYGYFIESFEVTDKSSYKPYAYAI